MKDDGQMKGWTFLSGDRDWSGCGAMWAKKAKDGSWFVLKFENMREYDRKAVDSGDWDEFSCEVKHLDFAEISQKKVDSALRSWGYKIENATIINEHNGELVADGEHYVWCLIDCCVSYGLGAPLHTETASKHPIQVRGRARRVAEEMMRNTAKLDFALDQPVNKIGSTAREYGRGDLSAAMDRHREAHEPTLTFGTLNEDGTVTNVRRIKKSDVLKCPFAILVAEHYRADGSCKCDDAEHRAMMIKEWAYAPEAFAEIPLRSAQ